MSRFDLRKSPVDGMIRKWERKRASTIKGLDPVDSDWFDHDVWVVTGVYKNRRDVFK